MRFTSPTLFIAGSFLAFVACSSSNDVVGGADGGAPEIDGGSTTSSSGTASNGGASGSTNEAGTDAPVDAGPQWTFKSTTVKFDHWGTERYYLVREPSSYDANKAYPLVVFLHGNPSDAQWASLNTP